MIQEFEFYLISDEYVEGRMEACNNTDHKESKKLVKLKKLSFV